MGWYLGSSKDFRCVQSLIYFFPWRDTFWHAKREGNDRRAHYYLDVGKMECRGNSRLISKVCRSYETRFKIPKFDILVRGAKVSRLLKYDRNLPLS